MTSYYTQVNSCKALVDATCALAVQSWSRGVYDNVEIQKRRAATEEVVLAAIKDARKLMNVAKYCWKHKASPGDKIGRTACIFALASIGVGGSSTGSACVDVVPDDTVVLLLKVHGTFQKIRSCEERGRRLSRATNPEANRPPSRARTLLRPCL